MRALLTAGLLAACVPATAWAATDRPDGPTVEVHPGMDVHGTLGHRWVSSLPRTDLPPSGLAGSVGVRAGADISIGQVIVQTGATARWIALDRAAFGAEVEVAHIRTGLWGGVGGALDLQRAGHVTAAAGWSLLGVEFRHVPALGATTVSAKLRLPLGALLAARREAKRDAERAAMDEARAPDSAP